MGFVELMRLISCGLERRGGSLYTLPVRGTLAILDKYYPRFDPVIIKAAV